MKKLILICFVYLFLFTKIALSTAIGVGILETLEGTTISIAYDNSTNIVLFSTEFYNSGSVGYKARMKIDVYDKGGKIFTGWSKEEEMVPGIKKMFDIYWFGGAGKYSAKLESYFANEKTEYREFDFNINKQLSSKDVFEIHDLRTHDNYLVFDLKSSQDAQDVVIISSGYIAGWIFEQRKIENIKANISRTVSLNYYPSLWRPSTINISVVSNGGKYYTEEMVKLEKIDGLSGMFYSIIDFFRLLLS